MVPLSEGEARSVGITSLCKRPETFNQRTSPLVLRALNFGAQRRASQTSREAARHRLARCSRVDHRGARAEALPQSELPAHAISHRNQQEPQWTQTCSFPWGQNLHHAQTCQSLEIRSASVIFSQKMGLNAQLA